VVGASVVVVELVAGTALKSGALVPAASLSPPPQAPSASRAAVAAIAMRPVIDLLG